MENPLINPNNLIDFQLKPHNVPFENGINYADDIEMFAFQSMSYTSLKDLMPASPSSTASPTSGSWREIPIKDPLVQHAAWAYLQPMAEARDEDGRRWWRRLEEKCCGIWGCFNDVVLVMFKGWFGEEGSDCDEDNKS